MSWATLFFIAALAGWVLFFAAVREARHLARQYRDACRGWAAANRDSADMRRQLHGPRRTGPDVNKSTRYQKES